MMESEARKGNSQRGAALFLLVLLLFVGGMALFFKQGGGNRSLLKERAATSAALAQARELAISFAVANLDAPGGLPFPDRNADANYDGSGDCVTGGFNPTQHLLGQWPFRTEDGCGVSLPAFGKPLLDGGGNSLWYAVSANLVKSAAGTFPRINSETLSAAGWFTVVDGQGAVLTNRAALVILAPGRVVLAQNRAGAAAPAQFLEGVSIGGVNYTNFAIEAGDTGFVARPADAAFNDQLVYVTIDELMPLLEERVLAQCRVLLRDYRNSCGQFPWPRPYVNPRTAGNFNSVAGTLEGLLPAGTALPFNWGAGCAAGITVPAWLVANNWHHLSYYALGSAVVQAGGGCSAGVDCLTVTGWPPPDNDKEAVVLLSGDALAGQNRAGAGGIADYFEATNAVGLDRLFTVQGAAPFNDRLEVVR